MAPAKDFRLIISKKSITAIHPVSREDKKRACLYNSGFGYAFQFGLSWGEKRSRSFRFVIIDEAFGRGSDESTRYGLQLFKKLNLQLVIVTPLQKINIIEDYINAVHFVSNPTGQTSVVRTITKEDYLKEKNEYFLSLEKSK